MLHPRAIKEFLAREHDDHTWLKNVSSDELSAQLKSLGFRPVRRDKPLDRHQMVMILLGIAYPRFAFWAAMGSGKTRVILELLNYFWQRNQFSRGLVLIPSESGVFSWVDQIEEWEIDIPFLPLGNGGTDEKRDQIEDFDEGLILATYNGAMWLFSKRHKKERRRINNIYRAKKFGAAIDAIIPDESTKLGNQDSLIYRICRAMIRAEDGPKFVWPLAGRPFGRDPTMMWSQQFLVDEGESLGDTLGLFRAAFFDEKRGWFKMYDYKFKEELRPKLTECIGHRSISYSIGECITLPKKVLIKRHVELPKSTRSYYEDAVKALWQARGDMTKAENAFLRMRQLSSGFLGTKDDETGEKAELTFPSNPKLDLLIDLVTEMPEDRKFVVFHDFTHSGRMISAAMKKAKVKTEWIWGGTKNTQDILRRFKRDPSLTGLVINSRIGSMVLNLQIANYIFYFESPVGAIDRDQSEARVWRKGQTLPCFIYDLICRGTADQKILDFHSEGTGLLKALLRHPEILGRKPA
jgi:hypothetical protein